MNRIDAYLNQLCWAMGGPFAEQQAVRDELRAHIEEQVREGQLAGVAEDEAVAVALRDLGHPEALGRRLRGSLGSRPLRRPIFQPDGAVMVGRPHVRHLPHLPIMLATASLALTALLIAVIYLWP